MENKAEEPWKKPAALPTWTDLKASQGFCRDLSATNRLGYGTASQHRR